MANGLTRFESFAEKLVEGTLDRLLGRRLEPVEIARRLVRIMEDNPTIGAGKRFVPNVYRVGLHPETFQRFISCKEALEAELAAYLAEEAEQLGFHFIGKPHVILTVEEGVRRGRFTVHAQLAGTPADHPEDLQMTQVFSADALQPANKTEPRAPTEPSPHPTTHQLIIDDRVIPLQPAIIHIGRSLENDIILQTAGVSRRHAQLLYRHGRWIVRDLNSTHGTRVNGHVVQECILRPGDIISLGDATIRFETMPADESNHRTQS